jgi:hypothetical protein
MASSWICLVQLAKMTAPCMHGYAVSLARLTVFLKNYWMELMVCDLNSVGDGDLLADLTTTSWLICVEC